MLLEKVVASQCDLTDIWWWCCSVMLAKIQLEDTKELLRTKSYNSSARTVVDENHEVLLGKLLSFALRHQVPKLEYELHSSK